MVLLINYRTSFYTPQEHLVFLALDHTADNAPQISADYVREGPNYLTIES